MVKKRGCIFIKITTNIILLITFSAVLSACSTTSYFTQGISGHLALMSQRVPIEKVIQDKNVSPKRKKQINQVQDIRKFAYQKLKLPKNNSYSSFIELNQKAVSWNVIATPKYSITPINTCFPLVGCVSYLLYFSKERAQQEVEKHKKLGNDAYIIASPAYSTMGLFDDPIVSTMFNGDMGSIAQLVFHELAHQQLFRKNDSAFNEAFASTVGEQGTRLWLKEQHPKKLKAYGNYLQKKWQFFNLILKTRNDLQALYKTKINDVKMEQDKQKILQNLKIRYVKLKKSWGGDKRYNNWFREQETNNAKLAVIGVYYQKVPEFNQRLKAFNYDFNKFYNYYALKKDLK